ncbi:hypothetical protein ATE48_05680 [Candidatus Viadribacter manganicus]|uniref:Uncharacterized protein n=1 Tax=Candidatus Viadribacter manganicus TaxID=1759059 RepID=A0A1B1AFX2_9PROT|nr:hypothetical protein ATE48_05680 [Candidatus Viadribacter manganicus]
MGLAISVGMLADLLVNDEEGAEWFEEDIAKLNGVLATAGRSPHKEPRETDSIGIGAYGYTGLHHLRRCAAHLHYVGALPAPLKRDEDVTLDERYQTYGAEFESENAGAEPGAFARASSRQFDHLIMHDDAEGFYVPQDFDRVLIAGDQAYGWVGSSYALMRECAKLADALQLPADLLANGEGAAFADAIKATAKGGWSLFGKGKPILWREHAIASMLCAKLHAAASHSIRTGSLVVFC